jgi:hypothetical protein
MGAKASSRNVSAKEALKCIRSSMSNTEIMERFKISANGLGDMLKQMYLKKLITVEDLKRRGVKIKGLKKAEADVSLPPMPPPADQDDQFLDTVTLIEILTVKPIEPPPPDDLSSGPTEIIEPD